MKTGDIVKQTYIVKNLHGENLKILIKLHAYILHQNISKFQIYFFGDSFFLSKLSCKIRQYSIANEQSYLPL